MGEWSDLAPHRVRVTSKGSKDDFSYDTFDPATERIYECLIDENESVQKSAAGVNLQSGLVAYVLAVPLGEKEPQDILLSDKAEILVPAQFSRLRPLAGVSRHFEQNGKLHNLELKWS